MFGNVKVGKGPNIVRGVRYQDNPDEQPQKNIFGRVLESAGNVLGSAAAQRNRMLAKKAAIREDKRAERLGFEEQIPQDEQPVFETEVRDIQQPTAFSSQAVDDTGRANLPQAMDMSRMVRNIDVSDPNQVMAFQQAFNDMGGNLKIDGKFGPNTLAALRQAQGQAQGQGTNTRTEAMSESSLPSTGRERYMEENNIENFGDVLPSGKSPGRSGTQSSNLTDEEKSQNLQNFLRLFSGNRFGG
jgi:hypothetical protein